MSEVIKEKKDLVLIISGPTANGKTSLAIDLAKKINGVIINADSQQVYKGLSILSSQPKKEEFKKIPHKLFNFLDYYKKFSVDHWFLLTEREIKKTLKNKQTPIVVGGTGMYLKALLEGLDVFPNIPNYVRNKAIKLMASIGSINFYKNLKKKNADCVCNINPNDKTRLIRSWELFHVSGKSINEIKKTNKKKIMKNLVFFKVLIKPSKQITYLNCVKRWNSMLKLGAIKEVEKIIKLEKENKKKSYLKTIGFKEIKDFLNDKYDLNIASQKAITATKQYAKRQYTWYNHQFSADITFKDEYKGLNKRIFLKKISDKLLTNQ